VEHPDPTPNVTWHAAAADAALRARATGQRGATAWLTGLSGSGKSTVAMAAEARLLGEGAPARCLDGDNLRHGLNAGLGFSAADRAEAVRRAGEAALLLAESGILAIVCMVSPYRSDRDRARERHRAAGVPFLEVFVDVPVSVAESRDPKGLYARARAGEIRGFTGIDDPYEAPERPDLVLRTDREPAEECVGRLVAALRSASLR